jgi:hypothetical protein
MANQPLNPNPAQPATNSNCPIEYKNSDKRYWPLIHADATQEFWDYAAAWLERARDASEKKEDICYFDAMIYLWVSFNAWLNEVADTNASNAASDKVPNDSELVASAYLDGALSQKFAELKRDNAEFQLEVASFSSLWPVFDTRQLHQLEIAPWEPYTNFDCMDWNDIVLSRQKYVVKCFEAAQAKAPKGLFLAPRCYQDHQRNNAPIPNDLGHTLQAIYQVRCSLFHGGKVAIYSGESLFVKRAFKILWMLWGESHQVARSGQAK